MCVALNGLEYVRRWLENLAEMLHLEELFASLEGQVNDAIYIQWKNTMIAPLERTLGQMMLFIDQTITRIGSKASNPSSL